MTMINGASENMFQASCVSRLLFQQLWSWFFLRRCVKVVYVQTKTVSREEHFKMVIPACADCMVTAGKELVKGCVEFMDRHDNLGA